MFCDVSRSESEERTAYLEQPSPGRNCTRLSRTFIVTKGGSRQTASPLRRSGYYARLLISSYNARAGPVARRWVLVSCTDPPPNASSRPLNYCRIPSSLSALHPREAVGFSLAYYWQTVLHRNRLLRSTACSNAGFQFRDYSVSYLQSGTEISNGSKRTIDNRGKSTELLFTFYEMNLGIV